MSVCMMAGTPPDNFILPITKYSGAAIDDEFSRLHVLKSNNQISWLRTILRNAKTCHGDFVFNADRLVRNYPVVDKRGVCGCVKCVILIAQ